MAEKEAAEGVAKVCRRMETAKETEKLDLSNCELIKIPDCIYFVMKQTAVKGCDLSKNQLKRIPVKFPSKFPLLTELDLSNNSLSTLPDEMIAISALQSLDISKNKFCNLPSFIYQCAKLQHLKANHNTITEIDLPRLEAMEMLTDLTLSSSSLSEQTKAQLQNTRLHVHYDDSPAD